MNVDEVLLTARLILVAIGSLFAVGLPLTIFFVKRARMSFAAERIWAVAPLVGAAAVILVVQNLLYLDVRVPHSAVAIWLLVAAAWLNVALSADLRALLKPVPWPLLSLGVLVYLIHGSGLLALGASNYYGYGWVDMYNYVSQAQFFIDYPFHSVAQDHGFLQTAQHFKTDRIGQSVLHAFIAVSGHGDGQQAFGVTILFSPFLIFFALYLLSSFLGVKKHIASLAALGGALLPAVASVHLECFFSQAMAMPFVILWPLAIGALLANPGLRSTVLSGLLLAVIGAIYTELVVPLLASAVAGFVVWCGRRKGLEDVTKGKCLLTLGLMSGSLLVALASNMGFINGIFSIASRTTQPGVLAVLYPWAFKMEGLARLWLGNQYILPKLWIVTGLALMSGGLFVLSLGWLTRDLFLTKAPAALVVGLVICFPLAPLFATLIKGVPYPYQFYKLVQTVSPLIVCFGTVGMLTLVSRLNGAHLSLVLLGAIAASNLFAVNRIAYASANPETVAQTKRGGAHLLMGADFVKIRKYLSEIHGRTIYFWSYENEKSAPNWLTKWLAYYARQNDVWVVMDSQHLAMLIPHSGITPSIHKGGNEVIGITWKKMPINPERLLFKSSPYWVYDLSDEQDLARVDSVSRITIARTLRLELANATLDEMGWYPIWVAGKPGSATLLTMQVSPEGHRFRYDQWGYPEILFFPRGACTGKDVDLDLKIMQYDKNIRLTCNGVVTDASIPDVIPRLELDLPIRFGDNRNIGSLGGKYPLAARFPGFITEISRDD